MRFSQDDDRRRFSSRDDLAASRGILLGLVIGLGVWLLIAAILLVVAE